MNTRVRILGIVGSLRKESYNRNALRAAIELAPEGVQIEPLELNDIPVFNQDHEADPPPSVVEFKRRIREADAVLFVTPEYNYSIPGVLKMRSTGRRGPTVTAHGRVKRQRSSERPWASSALHGRSTICD